MFLLSKGTVVAANPAAERLVAASPLEGKPSAPLMADGSEKVHEQLRLWSRSLDLTPGSFRVGPAGEEVAYICEGCRIAPFAEEPLLLLRFRPRIERLQA